MTIKNNIIDIKMHDSASPFSLAEEYINAPIESKKFDHADYSRSDLKLSEQVILGMIKNNHANNTDNVRKFATIDDRVSAVIVPNTAETKAFKNKHINHEVIANSKNEADVATAMIQASMHKAIQNSTSDKIKNSIFDQQIGARDLVVRRLAEPRKFEYGFYHTPEKTNLPITLDLYVQENPKDSFARIDYGQRNVITADFKQSNAKFNKREAVSATVDSIDNISNVISESNTESTKIWACPLRVSTSIYEQAVQSTNYFFDVGFDLHQMKIDETLRQQRMFMETEIIKSFARQPGETSSKSIWAPYLGTNAKTFLVDQSTENFFAMVGTLVSYILSAQASGLNYTPYKNFILPLNEYNALFSNDKGSNAKDLANLQGGAAFLANRNQPYTRGAYLQYALSNININLIPAPFFDPNDLVVNSNNTWHGINPYGNLPVCMLTAVNDDPYHPHALYKMITPASIGQNKYNDFEGTKVFTTLSVFTDYKILGGTGRDRLIISTNA